MPKLILQEHFRVNVITVFPLMLEGSRALVLQQRSAHVASHLSQTNLQDSDKQTGIAEDLTLSTSVYVSVPKKYLKNLRLHPFYLSRGLIDKYSRYPRNSCHFRYPRYSCHFHCPLPSTLASLSP